MSALPEIPDLNPALCVCEWTSFTTRQDFYLIHLFFSASLKFKCMQWSKPPFRKKRWCNKQKPPPLPPTPHRRCTQRPLCYSYWAAASLVQLRGVAAKCHQGAGVLRRVFFPPSSPHAFFSVVCPSAWNKLMYIPAQDNNTYTWKWNTYQHIDCFCWNLAVSHRKKSTILHQIPVACRPRLTHYACMWPWSDFIRSPLPDTLHLPDQSSETSNIPPQLRIHQRPIYTRLLMATLINFTGRQSNMASLLGLWQMCGVTFKVFIYLFIFYSDGSRRWWAKPRNQREEGDRSGNKRGTVYTKVVREKTENVK